MAEIEQLAHGDCVLARVAPPLGDRVGHVFIKAEQMIFLRRKGREPPKCLRTAVDAVRLIFRVPVRVGFMQNSAVLFDQQRMTSMRGGIRGRRLNALRRQCLRRRRKREEMQKCQQRRHEDH